MYDSEIWSYEFDVYPIKYFSDCEMSKFRGKQRRS